MTGVARRLATTLGLIVALLLGVALPAAADSTPSWDVVITVQADGSFRVVETITQDFGVNRRRGIFRHIPIAERLPQDSLIELPEGSPEDWIQHIDLRDINVSASPGAPTETDITRPSRYDANGEVVIRIGEEDRFITGAHTYRIEYTVIGAVLPFDADTSTLRWNVVGDQWQQNIGIVTVLVTGPGLRVDGSQCAAGVGFTGASSTGLEGFDLSDLDLESLGLEGVDLESLGLAGGEGATCQTSGTEDFRAQVAGLSSYSPFSIEVLFDRDQVTPSDPILQRKWNLSSALYGDSRAFPLAGLFALLGLGGVGRLLYRSGRDRETRGDVTVDGRTDTTHMQYLAGGERVRPLFQPRPVPIEFRPPDDLTPGEIGLIIDERVDPVDIAATIVHLAVRGHLMIVEESDKTLWWTKTDWTLKQTDNNPTKLMAFEQYIYDGLFDGRREVAVSDLKGTFAAEYGKAERALYEQGRKRGWFAGRPDKVRSKWLGIGLLAFISSLVAFAFAMYLSRAALVVVPLVLASLILLIAHRWMPRRTSKGSELLTRTLGFREFIETAETDRARFAEQENLFIDYLPYAIVFGATEKWAKAFAGLSIMTSGAGLGTWYLWGHGGGFDAQAFSSGLSDFSTSVGTAAVTAPPSSSSGGGGGFSGGGGGFGGGGGGSW